MSRGRQALLNAVAALLLADAALLLAGGSMSALACTGQILPGPQPDLAYNPFDAAGRSVEARLSIRNTSSETCAFVLSFSSPDGVGAPSGGPQFEIKAPGGALLFASGSGLASSGQLASPPLAPDAAYEFAYLIIIPAGQMLPPGAYGQQVGLRLQDAAGAGAGAAAAFEAGLIVTTRIGQHFGVNIAGGGTGTTVDFGPLTQGATSRVLIQTRSNVRFNLRVTSDNGRALALGGSSAQWRVPYSIQLDGTELASPDPIGPFVATALSGNSMEAMFTIGDVSGKRAGLYTDVVTIEIIPAI